MPLRVRVYRIFPRGGRLCRPHSSMSVPINGSLPRDERPPPSLIEWRCNFINELIGPYPYQRILEAFLCHMGISRNYFQSPEEVPTFIGDDGQGGCLSFLLPRLVVCDRGVRPLRDGEEPLLESTAGRTMELVLEQPEVESTDVLAPTPLRSVPGATVEPQARRNNVVLQRMLMSQGLKVRLEKLTLGGNVPETHPCLLLRGDRDSSPNVEATSVSSASVTHAVQSPPLTSLVTADDISRRDQETGPKAFEGMPVDQLMDEFDMVTAHNRLSGQLKQGFYLVNACQSVQKDEEIMMLKAQLADAQAEAESSRSYAQKLAEEKMALFVKVEQERANSADYKVSCHWAVKYLEGGKNNHFAGLDDFVSQSMEGAVAHKPWLRLAAMSALNLRGQASPFGMFVTCALARGKAEVELVAAMEMMKLLELPHTIQLERDQDYPIDVIKPGTSPVTMSTISMATVSPKYSELLGRLRRLEMQLTKLAVRASRCQQQI
ncbi:hypothetical protein Tco_0972613 [Tanacetum coccineum]